MSHQDFVAALDTIGVAYTENGAISNDSTGSELLNYFAQCGTYRDRTEAEVFADVDKCWAESPLVFLRILFYLRLVTRKVKLLGGEETELVQRGQGAKDEFRKAIKRIHLVHPAQLYENLHIIPLVGCWNDLWCETLINVLDREKVYELVKVGIEDEYHRALIAKYIPHIRCRSHSKTTRRKNLNNWGKGLCKYLEWDEKTYRKFKSDPTNTAHNFQRTMCQNDWDKLNFNSIPGRAMFLLNKKKPSVFERHDINQKYIDWILNQPTIKFTGYVYELFYEAKSNLISPTRCVFDRQFHGMVLNNLSDGTKIKGNVLCALDTSGSMTTLVVGKYSAYDICISLGIYLSQMNEGAFQDTICMFDSTSYLMHLSGTFTDKIKQIVSEKIAWGSTNFQSVIDMLLRTRIEKPDIPVEDYPETLLVVSDMQFNPTGTQETNYQQSMSKLNSVGLGNMKIIWWNVASRTNDFPSTIEDEGTTLISGFDASIISLILGERDEESVEEAEEVTEVQVQVVTAKKEEKPSGPFDMMMKALDQEILSMISISDEDPYSFDCSSKGVHLPKLSTSHCVINIVPPRSCWTMQNFRSQHLPNQRCGPHFSFVDPFVTIENVDEAADILREILADVEPFQVEFNSFSEFLRPKNSMLFLDPTFTPKNGLDNLLERIMEHFPQCDDQIKMNGKFVPHLSLARFDDHSELHKMKQTLESTWEPVSFKVNEIYILTRVEDNPFVVSHVIPLGDSNTTPEFGPGCVESEENDESQIGRTVIINGCKVQEKLEGILKEQGLDFHSNIEMVKNPNGRFRALAILEYNTRSEANQVIQTFTHETYFAEPLWRMVYPDVIGGTCSI
eukprot:TRINITY_DN12056_c0_g1_i1.p1 TRINITY_DN12056_c0_g1~~TRINITY_DN12056_c0_g1_i1.p1  ORF type:complete len:844 (-),score=168.87 TRINITY_DN12056_c0_g1_i1:167-2698(-)